MLRRGGGEEKLEAALSKQSINKSANPLETQQLLCNSRPDGVVTVQWRR